MKHIEVKWDNAEKKVIHALYHPQWSWKDYHIALDTVMDMTVVQGITYPIHFINEYVDGAQIPAGSPLPHHRRALKVLRVGITVYVTQDRVSMTVLDTFQQLLNRIPGRDFWFVGCADEARKIIAKHAVLV